MKISIRWAVIIGCIVLVWGTQLIITPFSFFSNRRVMLGHTKDIMQNILDLTLEETQNFFSVARGAAHLTKRLISSQVVNADKDQIEKLELYFIDQLELYSQFAGIYFATPGGDFYYVNRDSSRPGEGYRSKFIEVNEAGRHIRFIWRDRQMNQVDEREDPTDTYDPRNRPWYQKAVKEKNIVWTDPYAFFSSQKPGITTAGPIFGADGSLIGVVGVDIELDVLSRFVGKLRVGKTGMAFIINQDKDVIAFPDVEQVKYQGENKDGKIRLSKLHELDNPLCNLAYNAIKMAAIKTETGEPSHAPAFAVFESDQKKYYTMFTGVAASTMSWMIGVYIPEADYFGEINANRNLTLLITLVVSLLATIGGLMLAGQLIRPISELDQEARHIKNHDYSSLPRIKTVFNQIQRTADTFYDMKNAVVDYKKELEKTEKIHRDIWKQLQAARKMEAIGTLAGGIAHDFNNILSGIFGYAELLRVSLKPEDELQTHVDSITMAGDRARDLVRQILAFSFQDVHELKPLEVHAIINEACNLLASSLPVSVKIIRNIDENCRLILGDATQIHQVALNLMTNAFHAMEEKGGTLSIGLEEIELTGGQLLEELELRPGHYLCYSVVDTGVGITSQVMDKIFDPYFTTKAQGKGTGLGLAVIKGIVQNHRGGIHVESKPGKGSRFEIFLPLIEADQKPVDMVGHTRIQKGSEHILLVDDQKEVIRIERLILEVLGYRVTARLSGREALETFVASPSTYAMVITDMNMSQMSGETLARELMAVQPDIPVILLTGYHEGMTRDKARAMGIKDFLMKPVKLKEFSATIREILDHQT